MKRTVGWCSIVVLCLLVTDEVEASAPETVERLKRQVEEVRENLAEAIGLEPPSALERALRAVDEASEALRDHLSDLENRARETASFLGEMHEFAGPCRDLTPEEGLAGFDVADQRRPPTPPHLPSAMRERAEESFERLEMAHRRLEMALDQEEPELAQRPRRRLREKVVETLRAAEQVLERRDFVERRANWLMRVRGKLPSLDRDTPPCIFLLDVLPRPGEYTLEELRSDPLLPIRDLVNARMRIHEFHAEAIRRGDWALGIGTIWTPLDAPEWEVVEGPDGSRRLAMTNEDNRSGLPIAMIQFSPPRDLMLFELHLRPYVEVGASLDWDRPAFLFGGALQLGPFARVGVGFMQARVERPEGGLGDGDLLSPGQPLRLRDQWDGDLYVSMTIGVRELFRR